MSITNDRQASSQGWLLAERLGCLSAVLVLVSFGQGQVVQVAGGSSSLFQASGGSVEFHSATYSGWAGAGVLDGQVRWGAFTSTQWRGATVAFGDHTIPFSMATDIFDTSHYFLGRGASVAIKREKVDLFGFVGATSTGFAAPFFRGASPENGAGALFIDVKLTPKLRMFSRNVVSTHQTTINGLEWRPRSGLVTVLAAGMGANQGYLGSSTTFERKWISLKGAYILSGGQFRRVVVRTPSNSETDRENIQITLHPRSFLDLTAGRYNFLQPASSSIAPSLRATVNEYSANARAAGFKIGTSLFYSRVRGTSSEGTSFFIGRDFAGRVQANTIFFQSRSGNTPSTTSAVGMLREIVSPRLNLLQLANHTNGHTSLSLGGEFVSNPVSMGVEYQTIYSPFRTRDPFRQVLLLHVRLQPHGSVQINGGTYVTPEGSVKYTAYGSTLLYRDRMGPGTTSGPGFPKYVVRGRALDEDGQAVIGAALRICEEMVFTNSEGIFSLRKKKAKPCRVEVALDQFLIPGLFEVVSSPATVTPSLEVNGSAIEIVLRRLRSGTQ